MLFCFRFLLMLGLFVEVYVKPWFNGTLQLLFSISHAERRFGMRFEIYIASEVL